MGQGPAVGTMLERCFPALDAPCPVWCWQRGAVGLHVGQRGRAGTGEVGTNGMHPRVLGELPGVIVKLLLWPLKCQGDEGRF